jgi:hypothetical protein
MFGKLWKAITSAFSDPANIAKRNVEYIAAGTDTLEKIEALQAERMALYLAAIVPACHEQLGVFLKESATKNRHYLEVYEFLISFVNPTEIITEIELRCGHVSEEMYNLYSTGLLPVITEAVPEASGILSRLELNSDIRSPKVIQMQAALKRNLSPLYVELQRLGHSRDKMTSYFPQLKKLLGNKGINWGDCVQGGLLGFLANAHPILATFSWLAKIFRDKEKEKQQQMIIESADREFQDYLKCWDRVYQLCLPIVTDQQKDIHERTKIICEGAIRILHELNAAGHNLKKVPKAFEKLLKHYQQY